MFRRHRDRSDLIAAYQEYGASIRQAKKDQWAGIYYSLLIFSAIIAYMHQNSTAACGYYEPLPWIVWISYLFVIIFSIFNLWNLHYNIMLYRKRAGCVGRFMSTEFRKIVASDDIENISRGHEFPFLFSMFLLFTGWFAFKELGIKIYLSKSDFYIDGNDWFSFTVLILGGLLGWVAAKYFCGGRRLASKPKSGGKSV
jgi:hypothetical protein